MLYIITAMRQFFFERDRTKLLHMTLSAILLIRVKKEATGSSWRISMERKYFSCMDLLKMKKVILVKKNKLR